MTPEGGALPPGLCEEDFNTLPLVEAADTAPFFHNNAVDTLEAAVAFYNDDAFNSAAGGRLLASLDSGGVGIRLDAGLQPDAVAALALAVDATKFAMRASCHARAGKLARAAKALVLARARIAIPRDER